jgi:signal transduction histidine kinase
LLGEIPLKWLPVSMQVPLIPNLKVGENGEGCADLLDSPACKATAIRSITRLAADNFLQFRCRWWQLSARSRCMLSRSMFRGAIRKLSLRQKLVILASVGVLLPILVLTYLQYQSLTELENKTKGAFKENLRQGLTIVEQRMRQRLQDIAAQTLNPIGSMDLSSRRGPEDNAEEIEKYFGEVKRSHPEIEEIFAFAYQNDKRETNSYAYLYSDKFEKIVQTGFTPTHSHILFLFDKSRMAQTYLDGNRKYLFLHDSSPSSDMHQGTYLFYPLNDLAKGEQNGFGGVLLKESFVTNDLMAAIIRPLIDSHSPTMAITISDENSRVLYTNAPPKNGYLLQTNLDRPFSSWSAAVGLRDTNLDELARDSFLHSAGTTVLVLVFLLGGIALTIRATDREARLAQAKSTFVANVSHELKTPLSLISLFSEILELGRVNNEAKKAEYYGIISHESRRLNKTIDNILDFSRIEAGRKTYELVDGDIAEVIEHVLSTHRYQVINSGFDIQTDIQAGLPSVLIDRDAMAQAVSNLLDNAIKYSGKVKQLSITVKTVDSDLSIEIADRGVGIPRAEQAKIFEKFYRVGNGLVHDVKGSGLGLSLVKHIIEAHKGTISVESDVGKGTRFTILLPIARGGSQSVP